jgi:hypothetical protein
MADAPSYVILGSGYWAGRMHKILENEGRRAGAIPHPRRQAAESETDYKVRLAGSIAATGAQIAWICVPPGAHVASMIEAALEAGLAIVVEKPWMCPRPLTERLAALARVKRLRIGVHYQLCFLESVERWRSEFRQGEGLRFGGHFILGRPHHIGVSAIDNVGCHLFSIREYAVPKSEVGEIRCGYEGAGERNVWLESEGRRAATIDFLENREPIVQRFIREFETAPGPAFALDLDFALRIHEAVESVKRR